MSDDDKLPERRISHEELLEQVRQNREAIDVLRSQIADLESMLTPVAEFYGFVRSDINTLGRFGRGLRTVLAWCAAIVISAGVLVAWAKNGFTFPGE